MNYPNNLLEECHVGSWKGTFSAEFMKELYLFVQGELLCSVKSQRNLEILQLYFADHKKQAEIASQYDVTIQRINQIIRRSTSILKKSFEKMEFLTLLDKELKHNPSLKGNEVAMERIASLHQYQNQYEDCTISIQKIGLSLRTCNALERSGFHTVKEILDKGAYFVYKHTMHFGLTAFRELAEILITDFHADAEEWNEKNLQKT